MALKAYNRQQQY